VVRTLVMPLPSPVRAVAGWESRTEAALIKNTAAKVNNVSTKPATVWPGRGRRVREVANPPRLR